MALRIATRFYVGVRKGTAPRNITGTVRDNRHDAGRRLDSNYPAGANTVVTETSPHGRRFSTRFQQVATFKELPTASAKSSFHQSRQSSAELVSFNIEPWALAGPIQSNAVIATM